MIIEVDKKYFIGIIAIMLILGGTFFVISYGTSYPASFGHSANEIEGVCRSDGTGCPKSTFAGCTSGEYSAYQVGGYIGGDAKCNSQFPGSRMCNINDFPHAFPTSGCMGWFNTFTPCFEYNSGGFTTTNMGVCDCSYKGYSWASNAGQGAVAYLSGTDKLIISVDCSSSVKLLCCYE